MNIRQIEKHLEPFAAQPLLVSEPALEIYGIYVLQPHSLPADPQLFYLCTQEQYELLPPESACRGSFALYRIRGGVSLPEGDTSGLNLFILPGLDDPQEVYDRICLQFSLEHRISIAMKPMLDALFSNQGLQHLINISYNILKNPLFVSDSSSRYIANAFDENSFDEDSSFARFILNDILYGYIDNGGQDFIRKHKLYENISKSKEPYEFFHPKFQADTLICSLQVHDAVIGTLKMYAIEHPFTELDRHLFTVLAGLVSQELQRDLQLVDNRHEKSSRFLIDLITSSHADAEMMRRCTAVFKFPPDSQFSIAVSAQPATASALSIYSEQLKALFPASPSAIMENRIILLLSQNKSSENAIESALAKLGQFASQKDLPFGVSYPFADLSQTRSGYEFACCAVVHGQKHLPEKHIIQFKEIILSELFYGYQQHGKIASLIMPEVKALMAYDRENSSDYTRTLEVYLEHMGKSQRVCSELHIHKNTLLYRINKLSEFFGIDVDSGDSAFRAYLSLKVLQYLAESND